MFKKLTACSLVRSRIIELVFAGGIPITGYIIGVEDLSQLWRIWIMLVATSMVGWHILVVNDAVFPGANVSKARLVFALILPILSFALSIGLGYQRAVIGLLLMMANWHLYALYFKGYYGTALLCNFFGGLLHFGVGTLFFTDDFMTTLPYAVFFGLLMTGASMHHDALDCGEDKAAGYKTGAVRFGQGTWWRLGVIPMTAANVLIVARWSTLSCFFLPAFVVYVIFYGVYITRLDIERMLRFRCACRVIYGVAGGSYIIYRLVLLIGE